MNAPSFSVVVDVSEARAGAREAILVDVLPEKLNPGDVSRLAADLTAAVDIVNDLAPPRALTTFTIDLLGDPGARIVEAEVG